MNNIQSLKKSKLEEIIIIPVPDKFEKKDELIIFSGNIHLSYGEVKSEVKVVFINTGEVEEVWGIMKDEIMNLKEKLYFAKNKKIKKWIIEKMEKIINLRRDLHDISIQEIPNKNLIHYISSCEKMSHIKNGVDVLFMSREIF